MNAFVSQFTIDSKIVFLNHGSFGSTPRVIQDAQTALRTRMERNPMKFFMRDLEGLLDETRSALGRFVDARPSDLVFVANATTGVNAVLRSLTFREGDELLTTDHEYNACKNVLEFVAERAGGKVVVAKIPFPLSSEDEVVESILAKVGPRTRLALVDHVTSATGLVFPIARIAKELAARNVEVLVDGAHAPGMLDLSLESLAPHVAYYTANCHKWLCTPKGAAFLWVREDKQKEVRPHVISHGHNGIGMNGARRTDRGRYFLEFDWVGTIDPTAILCIGPSIDFLVSLDPKFRDTNRALALEARDILCKALSIPAPAPDSMIGSLAAVPIDDGDAFGLMNELAETHKIEVPVHAWPATPKRVLRVSAQLYNTREQYAELARVLVQRPTGR